MVSCIDACSFMETIRKDIKERVHRIITGEQGSTQRREGQQEILLLPPPPSENIELTNFV